MQKFTTKNLLFATGCMIAALAMGSSAQGALLAYEPFDYGDSTLSGKTGGTGWDAAWTRENAITSEGSLVPPAGYSLPTQGGRINTLASNGRTFGRNMATSIDMDPVAQTEYWMSGLFRRTDSFNGGAGEWMNILQLRPSSGADSNNFGATGSSELVQARLNGATGLPSAKAFSLDSTYLVLVKIVANPSGTADEAFVSIFETGVDTVVEPVTWDATSSSDSSEVLVEFSSNFGANVGNLEIDEIRIGTTLADVTGIPEPTALGVFLASGMCVFLSRRTRK